MFTQTACKKASSSTKESGPSPDQVARWLVTQLPQYYQVTEVKTDAFIDPATVSGRLEGAIFHKLDW